VYKNSDRVAHCDEGACFGDMALDKAVLRSADIICETESIIFKIEESDYKKIIFNFKSLEKHLNYKILTKVPLFSSMSFNKIENIVNSCATATFHSDEIIYEYGCQSHELYIVKNGRVELQIFVDIEKKNKWPIDSHAWNIRKINKVYAVPLKTINVNGCFGEYELINLIPRQTRAVALENTVCLCVNKSEFENFMSFKDSEFISNLNEDFRNSKAQAEKIYKKKILKFKDSNEVLIKTLNYSSKKVERLKESLISRKELEEKEIKKRIIKHSIINTIKNFDHFSNSNSRNI
jgi:signal-transduction protein with cAMP-binding, CBS, and nucleotidyltransferase domain